MSHNQNISGVKTPATQVSLDPAFSQATDGANKKALKALLSELEQLLSTFSEAAEGDTGASSKQEKLLTLLQKDPVKFAEVLKQACSGKKIGAEFHEVTGALSAHVASTKGYDNSKVSIVLKELFKGTKEEKEGAQFESTSMEMFSKFVGELDSGKTSYDEVLNTPEVSAFIGELSNPDHAATSQAVRASLVAVFEGKDGDDEFIGKVIDISVDASVNKTKDGKEVLEVLTSSEKLSAVYNSGSKKATLDGLAEKAKPVSKDESYVEAMMKIAVSLAGLLANVANAQTDTNDINAKISAKQGDNAKTLASNNIAGIQTELKAQVDASKKPWFMYLIAAVVAAAGAVATFFTAGAAGAAVALCVGVVMASPAGDAITGGLSKAMGGGAGGQAGAAAVTTAVTTILTLGTGGFAAAADEVVEEITEEIADVSLDSVAADGGNAAANGANGAVDATEEELANVAEEMGVDDAASTATKAGEKAATKLGKFAQKIKKQLNQNWSGTAFKSGILRRAVGTYLQGFLGSGGVTDTAEAIAEDLDPGLKNNPTAMMIFAVAGAIVSCLGALGCSKLTASGFKLRAKALKTLGLQNTVLRLSKPVEIMVRVVETSGAIAQGGFTMSQGAQQIGIANMQRNNAQTESEVTSQRYIQQNALDLQQHTTKSYNSLIEGLNETLNESLKAVGSEEQNAKRAVSR